MAYKIDKLENMSLNMTFNMKFYIEFNLESFVDANFKPSIKLPTSIIPIL
jgi:hypothetical protein